MAEWPIRPIETTVEIPFFGGPLDGTWARFRSPPPWRCPLDGTWARFRSPPPWSFQRSTFSAHFYETFRYVLRTVFDSASVRSKRLAVFSEDLRVDAYVAETTLLTDDLVHRILAWHHDREANREPERYYVDLPKPRAEDRLIAILSRADSVKPIEPDLSIDALLERHPQAIYQSPFAAGVSAATRTYGIP